MVNMYEFEQEVSDQEILNQLEKLQEVAGNIQKNIDTSFKSLLKEYLVLVEHHETIHKDCELLGEI